MIKIINLINLKNYNYFIIFNLFNKNIKMKTPQEIINFIKVEYKNKNSIPRFIRNLDLSIVEFPSLNDKYMIICTNNFKIKIDILSDDIEELCNLLDIECPDHFRELKEISKNVLELPREKVKVDMLEAIEKVLQKDKEERFLKRKLDEIYYEKKDEIFQKMKKCEFNKDASVKFNRCFKELEDLIIENYNLIKK